MSLKSDYLGGRKWADDNTTAVPNYTTTYTVGDPIEIKAPSWTKEYVIYDKPIGYGIQPRDQEGWKCPKCGRINAPWVSVCPCYYDYQNSIIDDIPAACRYCSNHPRNGGSGICLCTLGTPKITC